jgi:protease secretion system outer membrane protein
MSKTLKTVALACAVLCTSLSAHAMDLLQAYDAAQRNDPSILAARASTVADSEGVPQARSFMLPNISASASRTNNRLTTVQPNFLGIEQTSQSTYPSESQSVTLRQPLYRPQLAAQYRQAQAQVQDAEAGLQLEEQNLFIRVSSAYFEALLAYDQLALVLAQQNAYTTQLDVARKTFAGGSGTRTDVDEAQARLDMNRALETEYRQSVSYNLQQLETLVGEPVGELASLNVANLDLQPPEPDSLSEWQDRAEQGNPQVQSLLARVEVARQEVKKANAGHHPTLDAVVQWSNNKSESVTSTSTTYTNNTAGLQLNIPLFSGGYASSLIRQAVSRQERAERQLEAGRKDIAMRVYKEFRGVGEGIGRIKAQEQALRSADQLVLSSRKSFQAGSRTIVDVLNAEQQRVLVQRDLAQSRYLYLVSRVKLLALVGAADREALVAINRVVQP